MEAVRQYESVHGLLACDDFRIYADEGSGSLASSLSSLGTGGGRGILVVIRLVVLHCKIGYGGLCNGIKCNMFL